MDKVIVLDFGSQFSHLISRRIRDFGVYSEVLSSDTTIEELKKLSEKGLKGIILSGGAASVYDKTSPKYSRSILDFGIPIFGICYGHHLIAYLSDGKIVSAKAGEYGITNMTVKKESELFKTFTLGKTQKVWMNHKDTVTKLPKNYEVIASTKNSAIAAFEDKEKKIFGVQFHPEVTHTENGSKILKNFVLNICKAKKQWSIKDVIKNIKKEINITIRDKKAIIGLSGGVDSSTVTVLVNQVIGKRLTAVYVDTGLMRHKETEFMRKTFSKHKLNLKIVLAGDRFFRALKGITEPEKKRKIIGKQFIDIFDEFAKKENAKILIQGTIYSDRIESGITKHSSTIKSHHNVGGLPKKMNLQVYEPLRNLYKDEVRKLAKEIGLADKITKRHVFPGPGLGIRIVGEVTPKKAEIVRKASFIITEELKKKKLYDKVWMAFAVLLSIKSVGIQGDARSYKYPVVIRIIESKDAMTANFSKIPFGILEIISSRITNEIPEVNRVVYDVSNKPPSTMEWE